MKRNERKMKGKWKSTNQENKFIKKPKKPKTSKIRNRGWIFGISYFFLRNPSPWPQNGDFLSKRWDCTGETPYFRLFFWIFLDFLKIQVFDSLLNFSKNIQKKKAMFSESTGVQPVFSIVFLNILGFFENSGFWFFAEFSWFLSFMACSW